jgi:ABC-type phosphate/phosphonate transport system substrate-binding protein
MRRRAFVSLCGAGLLGLFRGPTPVWAAAEVVRVGLTDTLFPGLSGALLQAATRPFKTLLESALGTAGRIVLAGDERKLADRLNQNKVQFGIFQGVEFAWARLSNPRLEPIALCVRQQRELKAYLLVAAGSAFKKPAELRGKVLAVPDQTRHHCQVFLRRRCVPEPGTPEAFYKKVVNCADVEEALDEVVDGRAQAAVVDGLAWTSYRTAKPGAAAKLRVLLPSETFPCAVIACQTGRYSAAELRRFRDSLVTVGNSRRGRRLLELLRLSRFEAIPADYDRLLKAIATAYPVPKSK